MSLVKVCFSQCQLYHLSRLRRSCFRAVLTEDCRASKQAQQHAWGPRAPFPVQGTPPPAMPTLVLSSRGSAAAGIGLYDPETSGRIAAGSSGVEGGSQVAAPSCTVLFLAWSSVFYHWVGRRGRQRPTVRASNVTPCPRMGPALWREAQ